MGIAEEVATGVANAGGPLLDHGISRINKETLPIVKDVFRDVLRDVLDGAEINVGGLPVTIKLKPK